MVEISKSSKKEWVIGFVFGFIKKHESIITERERQGETHGSIA
jgi:hypothetical protein